ncbi:MAG: hypothetical protein Q8L48_15775 [Archangium sp.]|nr:hypothetical protein [Archangium sp.]
MKSAFWALGLIGCAQAPNVLTANAQKLATGRVTTKSELVLSCTPPDADVELDGVPQGTCEDFRGEPRGLAMGKGVRRVQVKKQGYLPWDTVVETDGTRVVMNVTLISTGGGTP